MKKNEMDDPTVGKIGGVGKLVKQIEMGAPRIGTLVKKSERSMSRAFSEQ